jgi:hypothetical protein
MFKSAPICIVRSSCRSADSVEAAPPFDLQIRMRKSRNAAGNATRVVRGGDGPTHQLTREQKSWQGKAADKL